MRYRLRRCLSAAKISVEYFFNSYLNFVSREYKTLKGLRSVKKALIILALRIYLINFQSSSIILNCVGYGWKYGLSPNSKEKNYMVGQKGYDHKNGLKISSHSIRAFRICYCLCSNRSGLGLSRLCLVYLKIFQQTSI